MLRPPPIDVIAAVITDSAGQVLLSQRTAGRDLAGLWEFPGGKREPDESPEAALARELDEELGIEIDVGAPLITVPHASPHMRLRLDVRRVIRWRGLPTGREGQALAWVAQDKLDRYPMPPADRPVVAALQQPDCYLVTPEPASGQARDADHAWIATLQAALDRNVRRVLVRLPGLDEARRRALLSSAVSQCSSAGAEVLVSGDPGLAREFAIGLQLRAGQLRDCTTRPLPAGLPLAASCHDGDQLQMAERLGCDFAVLGPVRATTTHPGAKGLGWTAFDGLREPVSLPIYGIGGLQPDDIAEARQHGAQGIAAIRGLWLLS